MHYLWRNYKICVHCTLYFEIKWLPWPFVTGLMNATFHYIKMNTYRTTVMGYNKAYNFKTTRFNLWKNYTTSFVLFFVWNPAESSLFKADITPSLQYYYSKDCSNDFWILTFLQCHHRVVTMKKTKFQHEILKIIILPELLNHYAKIPQLIIPNHISYEQSFPSFLPSVKLKFRSCHCWHEQPVR